MDYLPDLKIGRRGFFRMLAIEAAAAAAVPIPVEAKNFSDRRKACYRTGSREVQTFYRVNRYPEKTGK